MGDSLVQVWIRANVRRSLMIYLDNAATSFPKPPEVVRAVTGFFERAGACPGRGAYAMSRQAGAVVDGTRRLLARLLHAPSPERIVFTLNATDALNIAIKGTLVDGDHVVTTVIEHHSVGRPLAALEREGRIRVTRVPVSGEGRTDPADIRRAITPTTRLVAVVHASNVTGALQPIDDIAGIVRKTSRAWFLVDASQTAGAVPIDVQRCGIDLLAFPGHKSLLGPPGTGALVVGPRVAIRPWREGGTGAWSELLEQPDAWPWHLEAGSPNTAGLAGLSAAVEHLLARGVDSIRAHEMRLTAHLLDALARDARLTIHGPRAIDRRVAVVSVTARDIDVAQLGDRLDRNYEIAVRTGLQCAPGTHRALGTFPAGTLRISPGCFTTEAEIDAFVQALDKCLDDALASQTVGNTHHRES